MPCPRTQQANLPACSPQPSRNAKRQAGKLRMPFFKVFWYDSTRGMNPRSTDYKADALTTTPLRRSERARCASPCIRQPNVSETGERPQSIEKQEEQSSVLHDPRARRSSQKRSRAYESAGARKREKANENICMSFHVSLTFIRFQ